MNRRIAVMGVGAIGSSVGADLVDAGEDVLLVDQWPAHVEAMRADGLRVVMPDCDLQVAVRAMHLCDLAAERPVFDIVFLATKSYDTTWTCHLIAPFLAEDAVFVGLQNGMNDDTIMSIVGRSRTVASVVELSAENALSGRSAQPGHQKWRDHVDGPARPVHAIQHDRERDDTAMLAMAWPLGRPPSRTSRAAE